MARVRWAAATAVFSKFSSQPLLRKNPKPSTFPFRRAALCGDRMSSLLETGLETVIHSPRQAALEPTSRPVPSAQQVLVRVERTLISPGTELALYEGTHSALGDPEVRFAKYPFRPGYAAIGRVEAAGADASNPAVGQRVFFHGRHASWGLLTPSSDVWLPVPAGITDDAVLLARLIQIASTAQQCARRQPRSVLVIGAGIVGIFAAQVFQAAGVEKVAIQDINPERVALAKRCGVQIAVVGSGQDFSTGLAQLGGSAECVVVPAALSAVARLGEVVLLGSSRGFAEINLYKHVHAKGVSLVGAHEAIFPSKASTGVISREQLTLQAFEWLRAGKIRIDGLISHHITPEQLAETYARLSVDKSNLLGVVVNWC
jgi:2-desacetyl-2-hydroxyethyl bacteriochlorophyllide A dehydrogenase